MHALPELVRYIEQKIFQDMRQHKNRKIPRTPGMQIDTRQHTKSKTKQVDAAGQELSVSVPFRLLESKTGRQFIYR